MQKSVAPDTVVAATPAGFKGRRPNESPLSKNVGDDPSCEAELRRVDVLVAPARLAAQPGLGFEDGRLAKPRGKGIIRREWPRLARHHGEDVLRDLLRRARVFQFVERRGEDEIEMTAHHVGEGGLLAVARESLQQFKIVASLVHLAPIGRCPWTENRS